MSQSSPEGIILGPGSKIVSFNLNMNDEQVISINETDSYLKTLIKEGVINLGTANGWDFKWNEIYKELSSRSIPGSQGGRELGNCWNEHSFNVELDKQIIKVIYNVDSGD